MKKLLILAVLLCPFISEAQSKLQVSLLNSCSFIEAPINGELYRFESSNDATDIVKRICTYVGVEANFEVVVSNVPNAVAINDNGVHYIVYSEDFMQKLKNSTNTNWAAVSILAHEIGHHLNQHLLGKTSSRPREELEADKFSGFILRQMGASLDDAQIAVERLCPNDATNFYPSKSARLEAIAVGWNSGAEHLGDSNDAGGSSGASGFSLFAATLPRNIYAKEGSKDNFHYSGTGTIHISYSQNKIELSGNIDFIEAYPSGSRDIIRGSFNGIYYPTPRELRHKFPMTLEIPLSGQYTYGLENHPVWQRVHSFKLLKITVEDVNHVEGNITFSDQDVLLTYAPIVYH